MLYVACYVEMVRFESTIRFGNGRMSKEPVLNDPNTLAISRYDAIQTCSGGRNGQFNLPRIPEVASEHGQLACRSNTGRESSQRIVQSLQQRSLVSWRRRSRPEGGYGDQPVPVSRQVFVMHCFSVEKAPSHLIHSASATHHRRRPRRVAQHSESRTLTQRRAIRIDGDVRRCTAVRRRSPLEPLQSRTTLQSGGQSVGDPQSGGDYRWRPRQDTAATDRDRGISSRCTSNRRNVRTATAAELRLNSSNSSKQ